MAPTGRGSLRPYQPSKFQPFVIVCLFVTVIVVGFNFWNLMKKNSLLLVEIGKVQSDFKREESLKKECRVMYKSAEGKLKSHEDVDHEKEILLEDTRRIVEDLKAEADNLRQNITRLLSRIANAELFNSRNENKSQRECDQRVEAVRLEMQSSCDADKERLQHDATDQMDTMKKQLKLQFQETQQLDQMLQQQKQHPAEQEKKEPPSSSAPTEKNYIKRQGDIQSQQQQQQQQQHEDEQLQREKLRETRQQDNQINVQDDQKLPSGQEHRGQQHRGQQSYSVGDRKRRRKVPVNVAYNQTGRQHIGLHSKVDGGQVHGEKPDSRDQARSKDTYRPREEEQQQKEERNEREEVQRVQDAEPPGSRQETNDNNQQDGNIQVPSDSEKSQLEHRQKLRRQLFKRSDQNGTVSATPRGRREMAAAETMSRAPDQPEEVRPRSDNDAADDGDSADHLQKRDDVGEANRLDQTNNNERVDQPASVKPDGELIQNGQDKSKNSNQDPISLDAEKPSEGNADV